jgi:hypothetical protein
MLQALRKLALLSITCFAMFQLSGCATTTSLGECAAENYNPTIMSALDSFESAAVAIKLSNRVLLRAPLSEQDTWPSSLFGAPSGAAIVQGAFSMLGTVAGISGAAVTIDPETGFPRPQSALYICLKDRSTVLNKEINKDDLNYFKKKTKEIFRPLGNRKKPETYDENVYKNVLMA